MSSTTPASRAAGKVPWCLWCGGFPSADPTVPHDSAKLVCDACGMQVCGCCLDSHDCPPPTAPVPESRGEHTPGPWEMRGQLRRDQIDGATTRSIYAGSDRIAEVLGGAGTYEVADWNARDEANGRLFAAAPEQNSALADALYWLEHPAVHDVFRSDREQYVALERTIISARAAIAAAVPES